MLKYFCLVVLIMSSFGWTQEPIEFQNVIRYSNKLHKIKEINYYVINKYNEKELRRSVSLDYQFQRVTSDESYLNGELHGKSFEYDLGDLYEYGHYNDGKPVGKWFERWGPDSMRVKTWKEGDIIKIDVKPITKSSPFYN